MIAGVALPKTAISPTRGSTIMNRPVVADGRCQGLAPERARKRHRWTGEELTAQDPRCRAADNRS
jgi:hypothetical protein